MAWALGKGLFPEDEGLTHPISNAGALLANASFQPYPVLREDFLTSQTFP